MKVVAIVQARAGSTRFPNKVMHPISGTPLIEMLLRRLGAASELNQILVATSEDPRNDSLAAHVMSLGFDVFRGSETDVLDRYYRAAVESDAQAIVRITGDCPLVDPDLVDELVADFRGGGADYVSNVNPPTFPDGLDIEIFTFDALERAALEAANPAEREHVTPFIRDSGEFRVRNVSADSDWSAQRWTVDERDDATVIEAIVDHFAPRLDFSWREVLDLQRASPQLFQKNRHLLRNQGALMTSGQKLWTKAKHLIPGGNMLLSKRAEMFLPDLWPAYYSRAKDCRVWDLDGREFVDMSLMGVGTNTLGYAHPEVDAAVWRVIENGNMSTLNCPEEVYLAEALVNLHPWADMARFARSGGEADAIAIRIARAAAGRDGVAICGYHGWHDWYLAANLTGDKSLERHLLPGLEPAGVPQNLKDTIFPFNYNRLDQLEALIARESIGVIMMEVQRNVPPEPSFLQKVRDIATRNGIVLIFDECTSGFRQTFGGLHKEYAVEPDVAVFGKTLGNGYAISAVIGRRSVMEAAQSTFISSTFWTERIGPAAALKVLDVMERERSWETITAIGQQIVAGWCEIARHHGLAITTAGLPSLASFTIPGPNAAAYKTLITQEMLAKGYLAGTATYACIAHTPEIVDQYFAALDPVMGLIAECEDGRDVLSLLSGPVCHTGFARLN